MKSEKTKAIAKVDSSKARYFQRTLAPVSKTHLWTIYFLCLALLMPVSLIKNDYLVMGGTVVVVGIFASITDFLGRKRAGANKHHLLTCDRLPSDGQRNYRFFLISLSIFLLLIVEGFLVAIPGRHSPWPFLATVAFLFLVVPQMVAWRAIKMDNQ